MSTEEPRGHSHDAETITGDLVEEAFEDYAKGCADSPAQQDLWRFIGAAVARRLRPSEKRSVAEVTITAYYRTLEDLEKLISGPWGGLLNVDDLIATISTRTGKQLNVASFILLRARWAVRDFRRRPREVLMGDAIVVSCPPMKEELLDAKRAVERLGESDRELVLCAALNSGADAARDLRMDPPAYRQRLGRARKKLKETLRGR
jgi:hypothetical protein